MNPLWAWSGAGVSGPPPNGETPLATIRDVAREAGVSIATVSRVFNSSSLVSEDTAERVMQVAARFDYWPNGAAQSLTPNRTNTIGVLLPTPGSFTFQRTFFE